jgi:hypothetical protein
VVTAVLAGDIEPADAIAAHVAKVIAQMIKFERYRITAAGWKALERYCASGPTDLRDVPFRVMI